MRDGRLRVAFFGDDFSRRGKGTALFVQKIVEELVGHHADEVEVVLIRPPGVCESAVCGQVRSVIVPRRFSTMLSYLLFFMVHRERYDVVVFNRVVYPGFFFLKAKKFALVIHDASVSEVYTVPRTSVNLVFEYFLRLLGKYFLDAVIAVSEDAREQVIRYFGIRPERAFVVYPGVGDEYLHASDAERAGHRTRLKQTYGIRWPYLLDVSRFDPHKNIERMLDSFFLLSARDRIPHMLVLVGGVHTPGYSDGILRKVQNSIHRGDVRVIDYVNQEDMPALYACADVLVYPSLVEGFGLPVVEAMKCGTPVVTSNISSMPEVAADGAFLVDPLRSESIAEGVHAVLTDATLRQKLVDRGLRRAQDFTWTRSTDSFLTLVRSLVGDLERARIAGY